MTPADDPPHFFGAGLRAPRCYIPFPEQRRLLTYAASHGKGDFKRDSAGQTVEWASVTVICLP
jgi:hypothetical protein